METKYANPEVGRANLEFNASRWWRGDRAGQETASPQGNQMVSARLYRLLGHVATAAFIVAVGATGYMFGRDEASMSLLADAKAYRRTAYVNERMASVGFCPAWREMTRAERVNNMTCSPDSAE